MSAISLFWACGRTSQKRIKQDNHFLIAEVAAISVFDGRLDYPIIEPVHSDYLQFFQWLPNVAG
jgi:hypothetical protein